MACLQEAAGSRQHHPRPIAAKVTRAQSSGKHLAIDARQLAPELAEGPTASSNPTTTSSTTAASPGTSSSICPGKSSPSERESGPIGHDQRDLVLYMRLLRQVFFCKSLDLIHGSMSGFAIYLTGQALSARRARACQGREPFLASPVYRTCLNARAGKAGAGAHCLRRAFIRTPYGILDRIDPLAKLGPMR
jgi:hypothetical protein